MTPQELKNSILQLAILGKLVEQRSEEGTGEALYQQILAEKQKLIKAGTIKKEKTLSEITEDEKPFDIPEGWKWVRFGDAITLLSGTDFKPEEYNDKGKGIPYIIGASSLSSDGVFVNRWTETPRVIANLGDVLLVCKGSGYGKTVICDIEQAHIARQIMAIRKTDMIDVNYIRCFLMANLSLIKANGQGVIPGIDRGSVLGMAFPLPPLAEQKRIVAKIEDLLPYIDRYEKAWSKLEDFNKRFPGDMQKSILQMAIQGKLVEQRPEEGTGEELYQQIQAEKQNIIKAGTMKKEKHLPEITGDEKPFDIPESWKWVNLDNIAVSGLGKTLDKAKNTGDFQPYLCSINVYWSGIDLSKVKEARFEQNELTKYKLEKGDLLICEGGDVGRSAIWNSDNAMYYQNALHRVRFYGSIDAYFYKYLLECYKGMGIINEYSKGMTIKHLVQSALNDMWLPLPPLAEQKRIVSKLEEILPLCEKLK